MSEPFRPFSITRPDPILLKYYVLASLFAGPAFFIPLIVLLFRYHTLRYRFDEKGISMSWGVLFRREVLLTYRRIQDIHLTRGILQRWLGLATVSIQTASGASSAEMSIEGVLEAEALRDFLYHQMRGARGLPAPDATAEPAPSGDEVLVLLREIRDSLLRLKGGGA